MKFREHSRFIRGIIGGLGFRQTTIQFEAPARHAGTSKFSMRKMIHFAMDGILTNSTVPLRIAFYVGILSGIIGVLLVFHVIYCYLMEEVVPGWATMTILISLLDQ